MAKPLAVVEGVALKVGRSRNNRWYSREALSTAVERVRKRLAEGGPPVTMRSHHAAEDDSLRIVGGVVDMWLSDPDTACFRAHIAPTDAGRTLCALIEKPKDGPAYLENVSIRGWWRDEVRPIAVGDGDTAEGGDDLELDGLDWTASPGVTGAMATSVTLLGAEPTESAASGRTMIYESVEAHVTTAVTETAPSEPAPDVVFADNAYLPDRVKRYPLDTRRSAVEAWSALTTTETARDYTAAQLKRARGRTVKALEQHGVTVTTEGHLRTAGPVDGSVLEMWPNGEGAGGYSVSLYVGPLRVEVCSYAVDPHDLDRIARVAATAAADCLSAVQADPDAGAGVPVEAGMPALLTDDDETEEAMANSTDEDERDTEEASKKPMPPWLKDKIKKREDSEEPDGDEDTDATDGEDDGEDEDEDGEDGPKKGKVPAAFAKHQFKAKKAGTKTKETAVADSITETSAERVARLVAEGVAKATEEAQVARLIAEGIAAANAPKETEAEMVTRLVAEGLAAAQPKETDEQRIARLVQEGVAAGLTAAVQTHVERNGAPQRTGLVNTPGVAQESTGGLPADWPTGPTGAPKAVHELTESERGQYATPMLADYVEGQLKLHHARRLGLA